MKPEKYQAMVSQLSDRTADIRSTCQSLVDAWGFDLDSRKPGIAYVAEDGTQVTTLDMACMLAKLVEWEPIIDIPDYISEGVRTIKDGQIVVSNRHRHGKIVALVSNKDRLKYSLRMFDMNVMSAKDVGDYRTFTLFADGDWYPGWDNFSFQPTKEEKQVLARFAEGNKIAFDTFIHSNRWPSFYGRYYLLAMHAIQRMTEQLSHLKGHLKVMEKELGIEPPPYPTSEKDASAKTKEVQKLKFNVEVAPLGLTGEYSPAPMTQTGYEATKTLKQRLTRLTEILRFQTRATDFAFVEQLKKRIGEDPEQLKTWICQEEEQTDQGDKIPLASWVKDKKWIVGYQIPPRKKNKKYWCHMDLDDNEWIRFHLNTMKVTVKDDGREW